MNKKVACSDGFTMSVQANEGAYCTPRYNEVERYSGPCATSRSCSSQGNKVKMSRNFLILTILLLFGCVVVYEDGSVVVYDDASSSHHDEDGQAYASVWVGDLHVDCYENYGDSYDWYFEIYADSYYGPSDVEFVDIYINSWKWIPLERSVHGYWTGGLRNTHFYCDNTYDFEVVAADYYGNTSYRMFYW